MTTGRSVETQELLTERAYALSSYGLTCVDLISADGLPAAQAVVAATAGVVQPGVAHAVADLEVGDAGAQLHLRRNQTDNDNSTRPTS